MDVESQAPGEDTPATKLAVDDDGIAGSAVAPAQGCNEQVVVVVKGGKSGKGIGDGSGGYQKFNTVDQNDKPERAGGEEGDKLDNSDEKREDEESTEKVSLLRLYQFAMPWEITMIVIGSVMACIHGVGLPAVMIVFGDSVQTLLGTAPSNSNDSNSTYNTTGSNVPDIETGLRRDAIIYTAMGAGVWITSYFQVLCWYTVGESMIRRIRRKFLYAVLHKDIGWFDTNKTGELASRLSDDILKIYDGLGDKNAIFFQWMACAVAGFVIGFYYSWRLTLVILATTPLIGISSGFLSKLIVTFGEKEQAAYAKAGSVAEEVLSSIRTVVAFGGEDKESERYERELEGARSVGVWKGLVFGVSYGFTYLMVYGSFALAFWYGSVLVWKESITGGDMVTTFFAVLIASFAIGSASPGLRASSIARGAAVVVYNIIDEVPAINSASEDGARPLYTEGNIEFDDVHFHYPARPEVQVLKGLSLSIKKGTTTALVGPSGCGKSTLIQLLQRFYDPGAGKVTIDGHDIRDLHIKHMRSQMGIVSQEPILFHDTIAQNIAFGSLDENVSRDEIIAAAKLANAHNFIMDFPDGYETQVGERGAQMSGGQKQRIAIARALIRNPRILLLDEATSALDTESERIVQAALDKAREGRTTIIIAHRLSTIQNSDCIVAIADGQVAEKGTHAELVEKRGLYYALVTMQAAIAEASGDGEDAQSIIQKVAASTGAAAEFLRQVSVSSGGAAEAALVSTHQLAKSKSVERQKSVTASKKTGNEDDTEEDAEEEEELPEVSAVRLLKYNKPEFPVMALGVFCATCIGVLFPLFGVIFAQVLDVFKYVGQPEKEDLYDERSAFWSGMFAVLGFFAFLALSGQHFAFSYSGEALTKRMRSLAFRSMLRKHIGFFDEKKNSTGALTTQLSTDAALIQGGTGSKMANATQFTATLITALAVSFSSSWHLTLVILGACPVIVVGATIQTLALAGFSSAKRPEQVTAGKLAIEFVDNIRTVASLGLEERAVQRYMDILEPLHVATKRTRHVVGLSFGFGEASFFFIYAITFSFGGFLIAHDYATFSDVFMVFGAMVFGAMSVGEAASLAPDFKKATRAASRILVLVDGMPEIDSQSEEGERLGTISGDVALRAIQFSYPTRPDVHVLDDTTITAERGQTVALVGQSGCGKSTSVSLLERFYDPKAGTVNVDGHDIRTLNLKWLRQQMGIVQQEPILFDASIADNIAYGALDREVGLKEVEEVARKANIHNFISTLPEAYDTNVGAKGTQLSGGQKQRVAIARALIRNPKILLLDEATSALDSESEKVVQEALDVARQGRTSIVIAHRLSTIHSADKIVVLGGGKVLEQGTHSELMALQGAYYKLNCAQQDNEGATLN